MALIGEGLGREEGWEEVGERLGARSRHAWHTAASRATHIAARRTTTLPHCHHTTHNPASPAKGDTYDGLLYTSQGEFENSQRAHDAYGSSVLFVLDGKHKVSMRTTRPSTPPHHHRLIPTPYDDDPQMTPATCS